MRNDRRDFLRHCTLAGLGLAAPLRFPFLEAEAKSSEVVLVE